MKSMAYVCTVSNYNLPELEACLTRQPSDVLLVVSDKFRDSAELLHARLNARLPETTVHLLHQQETQHALSGDDLLQSQQWVRDVLVPRLKALSAEGKEPVLNFTGGTKSMAMVLLHGYRWSWVDYKAQNTNKLEALRFLKKGEFRALYQYQQKVEPTELVAAEVLDIPRLHNKTVEQSTLNEIIDKRPGSPAIAQELWDALEQQEPSILGLFKAFDHIWSAGRENEAYKKDTLTLSWAEFFAGSDSTQETVLPWLEKFQTLMPNSLHWNEDSITLPGNEATKKHRALRAWINGLWLEQLGYEWLRAAGVPDRAIGCGVTISEGEKGKREADLLVHYQGKTSLIEVKTDVPPGSTLKSLEEQLASIGESRFGQNNKVLFCGPELSQRLNASEDESVAFKARCKTSGVKICTTRAELLKAVCNL